MCYLLKYIVLVMHGAGIGMTVTALAQERKETDKTTKEMNKWRNEE